MAIKGTFGSLSLSSASSYAYTQTTGRFETVAEQATRLQNNPSIDATAARMELLKLCSQVNGQADWMAVHSAARAKDCLNAFFLCTLKASPHCLLNLDPGKLDESKLQAWYEFCTNLPSGVDREDFVQTLAGVAEMQINAALNACCDDAVTAHTFETAWATLKALEPLAVNDHKLRTLIDDAKVFLNSLPTPPPIDPLEIAEAQINTALANCYTPKDGEDPLLSAFATLAKNTPLATGNRHLGALIEDAKTFLSTRLGEDIETCANELVKNPLHPSPALNSQIARIDKIGAIHSLGGVAGDAYAFLGQFFAHLPVNKMMTDFVRGLALKVVAQIQRSIASDDHLLAPTNYFVRPSGSTEIKKRAKENWHPGL